MGATDQSRPVFSDFYMRHTLQSIVKLEISTGVVVIT
jgi:hypothetical protein